MKRVSWFHLQLSQSTFSTAAVTMPHSSTSAGSFATYNEVVGKLNSLFDDFSYEIERLTDVRAPASSYSI